MDNRKRVEWLDLPKELWALIAKRLNTTLDVLRFRSICKSWRSAIPLPSSHSLFPPQIIIPLGQFSLLQTKIYRLEPSPSSQEHPSISSLSSKGWIIKVGESKSIPLRLLNPFTNFRLSPPPNTSPKVLNLFNFRVVELIETYTIYYASGFLSPDEDEHEEGEASGFSSPDEGEHEEGDATGFSSPDEDEHEEGVFMPNFDVRKVVLYPPSFDVEGRVVFALYEDGKLGFFKIGDENWNFLDDGNSHYDDMILHRGQVYVVDKWGTIFWVDCSSLKLVQFSPILCGFGKRKYLVESGGSLYVVDMCIEEKPDDSVGMWFEVDDLDNPMEMPYEVLHPDNPIDMGMPYEVDDLDNPMEMYYEFLDPDNPIDMGMSYEVVDVKVYKLDEEWGKWLDVKNLGDVVFVLGKDCNFSLSAQDYYGCEGNCVYFYSQGRACAFSLDNSKLKSPNPFWPCPSLFHPKFNL